MYQNKPTPRPAKRQRRSRANVLLLSLLFVAVFAIGGTLAYFTNQQDPVENTFAPSNVDCTITEEFDGRIKKDVNVQNSGDTDVFIRVKLVSYRINNEDERIGGLAPIPAFTPGSGWVEYGGLYYYTAPVAPGAAPQAPLIGSDGIQLAGPYDDLYGGYQVIEVLAEAIQSAPAEAVGQAWNVRIANGAVGPYTGN